MSIKCNKCGKKEFKVLEDIWEELDLNKTSGKIAKGIACSNCGKSFIAKINIEIKDVSMINT